MFSEASKTDGKSPGKNQVLGPDFSGEIRNPTLALEGKDRAKFGTDVVELSHRPSLEGGVKAGGSERNCPGAIQRLFKGEGDKAVELVLQLRGGNIAVLASAAFTAHVAGKRLVAAVVQIHRPPGVSPFRIGPNPAREGQSQIHKSTLRPGWELRSDDRNAIQESKNRRRRSIDALRGGG